MMRRVLTVLTVAAMVVATLALPALAGGPQLEPAAAEARAERPQLPEAASDTARAALDKAFAEEEPAAPTATLGALLVAEGPGGFDEYGGDYDIIRNVVLAILGSGTPTNLGAALDPGADLTVFLPNDRAFQRLVDQLAGVWLPEDEIIDAILGAGFSIADVNGIVENHVFIGAIPAAGALEADGVTLTAVGGGDVTVDVRGFRIVLVDDGAPYPMVVDRDNFGTNGVFHGISQVILSS
jgi:hypothetical protein